MINLKNRRVTLYPLLIILFILSGCGCSCSTVEGSTSNYQTYSSYVTIFADGCSDEEGSTSSAEPYYSTAKCDDYDEGDYRNRGRWTKMRGDASSVMGNDNFSVDAYGSVYYCSYGYDNKNPSPTITIKPANPRQTLFEYDASSYSESEPPAPTELPVQEGQLIVLEISQSSDNIGIFIGDDSADITTLCTDTQYNDFVSGICWAKDGHGLTVYVDDTEVVTLDNLSSDNKTYSHPTSRYPNLYKPLVAEDRLEDFYAWVDNK